MLFILIVLVFLCFGGAAVMVLAKFLLGAVVFLIAAALIGVAMMVRSFRK